VKVVTEIGADCHLELKAAILIYRDEDRNGQALATVHDIAREGAAAPPQLAPGILLTTEFLAELTTSLRRRPEAVLLPENVLAYSSGLLIWWTPRRLHAMFFSDGAEDRARLDGRVFPHPPLVWKVNNGVLSLRALAEERRPSADTSLMTAPYWNTEPSRGQVCVGTMPRPTVNDFSGMLGWEEAFFNSRFTHPSGIGKLTKHPGGFVGLWAELAGAPEFPIDYLVPSKLTLHQFVEE
jgi:PRTRC genetic system protein B